MKKSILIVTIALSVFSANAQIKVFSGGNVAIGTTSTPSSVLSVGGSGNSLYKGYFYNSSTSDNPQALRTEIATPTNNSYHAYSSVSTITCGTGYAYGLYGSSYNSSTTNSGQAFGIYGLAGNSGGTSLACNFGVMGELYGSRNGAGIFGTTSGNTQMGAQYAGYFKGDIYTTDDTPQKPNAGSWSGVSDIRLKKDTSVFTDGLYVIRQIKPMRYKFNGIGGLDNSDIHIGIIAQDIQTSAPYCVGTTKLVISQSDAASFSADIVGTSNTDSSSNYIVNVLTYNPDGLFYALINSVKQLDSSVTGLENKGIEVSALQQKYDSLEKQMAQLESHLNQCCPVPNKRMGNNNEDNRNSIGNVQVELANKNDVILYQNEPNPFNNQTIIRYFIPDNVNNTFIVFYDEVGKEINRVEIKEKGFGKIEANTENLASGIYTFSIVVDEKVIDTKKMMRNK